MSIKDVRRPQSRGGEKRKRLSNADKGERVSSDADDRTFWYNFSKFRVCPRGQGGGGLNQYEQFSAMG